MYVQRCRAGYDNEPCDHIGKDAAHDYIPARSMETAASHAFFHDRSLQIELHPRGDRSPDYADNHVQVCLLAKLGPLRWLEGCDGCDFPRRVSQRSGEDVSDVEE